MSPTVAAVILVVSLSAQVFAAPYICTTCQTSNTHRIYQTQTSSNGATDNLSQGLENLEDLTQHTESDSNIFHNDQLTLDNARPGNWTDVNRYRTPDGHGQVYEEQGQRVQGPSRVRFYRKNFTTSYSSGNSGSLEVPDLSGFDSYNGRGGSELGSRQSSIVQQSALDRVASQGSFGQSGNSAFHRTTSHGNLYGSQGALDSTEGSSSYRGGSTSHFGEDGSALDSQTTQQEVLGVDGQKPGNWSTANTYRTNGGNGRVYEERGQVVTGPRHIRYFRKNYTSSYGGAIPTIDGGLGGQGNFERVIEQLQRQFDSQGREVHQNTQGPANNGYFHHEEYHGRTGSPLGQPDQRIIPSNYESQSRETTGLHSHHTHEFQHGHDFDRNHDHHLGLDHRHRHEEVQSSSTSGTVRPGATGYHSHRHSTGSHIGTSDCDSAETQQVLSVGETEAVRPFDSQSGSQYGHFSQSQGSENRRVYGSSGWNQDQTSSTSNFNREHTSQNSGSYGTGVQPGTFHHYEQFQTYSGSRHPDIDRRYPGVDNNERSQRTHDARFYQTVGPSYGRSYRIQSGDLTTQGVDLGQMAQDADATRAGHSHHQFHQQRFYRDAFRPENDFQQTENLNQQTQDLTQQTEDLTQQTEDLTQQTEDLTQQTQDFAQHGQDLTQQTEDLTQQTQDFAQHGQDLTQQTEDLTQQTQDLTQQTQDFTQQSQDLTQQTQQIRQQSEDLAQHTQDLIQQTQDFTQQNQDFGQQTQQISQQSEDLSQQTQDLTQQTQDLTQQTVDLTQQTQDLTQQTQDLTQQTVDLTQQTQDLTQQSQDLTQQTEDLTQQTQDFTQQSQDLVQQTEDLTQQTQDLTQQTEDLSQHTQGGIQQGFQQDDWRIRHHEKYIHNLDYAPYGHKLPESVYDEFITPKEQGIGDQQTQDLFQQTEDLTQQTEDLTQQTQDLSQDLTQQTEDLTQQTEDLTQQTDDLTHQTEDLTQQRQDSSQDLTQQTEDLTQQVQDFTHQNQDLTQQTEDLTQQTEDLTQQTQDFSQDLTQQTEDLTQQTEDLTQQTEHLTQQTEDLTQQTQDFSQHLTQQTEDLTQQTEDLTQQTEDLTQQTQDFSQDLTQQTEDLTQQTEDLTQQTEDLTQQTQDFSRDLTQQTEDLTQQTEDLTQQTQDFSQDLTQQTEDLTQQTEDLTQQTEDLTQQTEDLTQQTEDLTQQTEHGINQNPQQYNWRYWQHEKQIGDPSYGSNEPQSPSVIYQQYSTPQEHAIGNQHTEDLTQQTEDLTQQTEDLTQQTEDLNQQTEDLTQQTEDLTQQTEDLTQQTEDLSQQSGYTDDHTNQRTSSSQFIQEETLRNVEQVARQPSKPAPKPKRIRPSNFRGPQQIDLGQEDTTVIFTDGQPIPSYATQNNQNWETTDNLYQNARESSVPPTSNRGDQSFDINANEPEFGNSFVGTDGETSQVHRRTDYVSSHEIPPVQQSTSENQFRQVQPTKTKTRSRPVYRPQSNEPHSWERGQEWQPPRDVTTSQGPAIRYTDANRNPQDSRNSNFGQEVRQRWVNPAESQPSRFVQGSENTETGDQTVPVIGTRILQAYGGSEPSDKANDPDRYASVKPNPSVTFSPNSGDKDSWEIYVPPVYTTTTEASTVIPIIMTSTTTTTTTPAPTSPPQPPTPAPGFWNKLGHSLASTYDKAKEKAKEFFG